MSTTNTTTNNAAWLTGDKVIPLKVQEAPYPIPLENQIIIKTSAIAVNPIDWMVQRLGSDIQILSWIQYPLIPGSDVAGTVVQIGSTVQRFKVGDRVVGFVTGKLTKGSTEAGFQEYTAVADNLASPIPDSLSFEKAAVLPLGLSTAASSLFRKDHLALKYPSLNPKPTGETVLISGGASSVGCNAIQLAVAAGYEVFTTASPKNFKLVQDLGASKVFDYNSDTVTQNLIEAFKGKKCVGAMAISAGSEQMCFEVVAKSEGGQGREVKFVSTALPVPENLVPSGVIAKHVYGDDVKNNDIGKTIYEDFLPNALAWGKFVAAPEPHVVGKGLSYLQAALDEQMKGVSAKKIVVLL